MVHIKRIAVTLPAGPRVEDTINRIRWAEENGIPDAWFSDSGAPDTLTQVAAVAHTTHDIRIGTAVTPVYTRSPSVLAASANVIGQLFPVGLSWDWVLQVQTIMTQLNGIPGFSAGHQGQGKLLGL